MNQLVHLLITRLCHATLYLSTGVIFVILTINTALRYLGVAQGSMQWANEVPELLFPWLIMAGVVLAALHGSHIAVVILTHKLPNRVRRAVLVGGSVAVIALYLSLTVLAYPLMQIQADERTPILHVPGSVTVICLMLGFSILALVTALRIPQLWAGAHIQQVEDTSDVIAVTTKGTTL